MIARRRCPALLIACTVLLASAHHVSSPPKRAHHAMVYDPVHEVVLLAGGSTPADSGRRFQFYDDVWAFKDSGWRRVSVSGRPVSGIGLAYDEARNRVVSFGGYDGTSLGVLRFLAEDHWQTLGDFPTMATAEPGFVYDTRRDRLVVFGGSGGSGSAGGTTFEYADSQWTRIPIAGPAARQAHIMVYDSRRGRTVLFGGMGAALPGGQRPPTYGDTWEYDGSSWVRYEVPSPSPRQGAGAAFDSRRGLVVIFGGMGADGFLGDTWAWDGDAWRKLATVGPGPRAMGYLAYDQKRDRIVLFGGRKGWPDGDLSDTWEWDGSSWRRVD